LCNARGEKKKADHPAVNPVNQSGIKQSVTHIRRSPNDLFVSQSITAFWIYFMKFEHIKATYLREKRRDGFIMYEYGTLIVCVCMCAVIRN
jgi:hypothetical protein